MPWTLDDAEARAAEAPRTFFIPPAEVRRSLKAGDEVKLIFCLEREDGEAAVERMWVEVVETDPYLGRLRNTPHLPGVIAFDDQVAFGPEHVCGYAYPPEELGYDPTAACSVLKRLADADERPPLLLLNDEGEWEAHAEDEEDAAEVLHWRLGYLTDRFPETATALREGARRRGLLRRRQRGVWWRWDGERYVRSSRG